MNGLSRRSLIYLPKVIEEKQTGGATSWRQIAMDLVSRPKWIKVKNLRGIISTVRAQNERIGTKPPLPFLKESQE